MNMEWLFLLSYGATVLALLALCAASDGISLWWFKKKRRKEK